MHLFILTHGGGGDDMHNELGIMLFAVFQWAIIMLS